MHAVRRIIAGLGRSFISVGVLVLLFVMYELYGTSLAEGWAQDDLKKDLEKARRQAAAQVEKPGSLLPNNTPVYVPPPPPPPGAALAMLKIPKLNLFKAVVEGVDTNDLKKGPGHYAGTPLPGEAGNVAIAGHRTTYGAPFYRINELVPGDPIEVTTKQGTFTYKVTGQKIVGPNDNYVLDPTEDNRLTLTTCHPRFSAAQRLIVFAELDGPPLGVRDLSTYYRDAGMVGEEGAAGSTPAPAPAPAPAASPTTAKPGVGGVPGVSDTATPSTARGQTTATSAAGASLGGGDREGGVSGEGVARGPAIQWGVISALVALATYFVSRRWKKWPAYAVGTPVFLVVLFVFFENFAALLPANV